MTNAPADGIAVLVGLVVGSTGAAVWMRWRHQVVKELRIIRKLLQDEQEPTLRLIRDLLLKNAEPTQQPREASTDASNDAAASQVQNLDDDSYVSDDLE